MIEIKNPLVYGYYSDPSILVSNNTYYMSTSACGHNTRVLAFHKSKDLVNWEYMYHLYDDVYVDKKDRFMYEGFATDLVKVKGKYYLYCYTPGFGNWVSTCEDIEKGNWTKPHFLSDAIHAIDPGHLIAENGKRYLMFSKYKMYELTDDGMDIAKKVEVKFDKYMFPDEVDIEGIYPEGPKALYYNGYYYWFFALGGTGGPPTSHGEIAYRSKDVFGPYESCPYNPILHTVDREENWWSTGHSTIFKALDNKFYAMYHGLMKNKRYLGRMPLISEVEYTKDGWFKIKHNDIIPKTLTNKINNYKLEQISFVENGKLGHRYNCYDDEVKKSIKIQEDGSIILNCIEDSNIKKGIYFMPDTDKYELELTLMMPKEKEKLILGIVYDDQHYTAANIFNEGVYQINNYADYKNELISCTNEEITVKMKSDRGVISFWYIDGKVSRKFSVSTEVSCWNPTISKGFENTKPFIKACGEGKIVLKSIKYNRI